MRVFLPESLLSFLAGLLALLALGPTSAFAQLSKNVLIVAFAPGGKSLASRSDDNSLKLWDVATGKEIRRAH